MAEVEFEESLTTYTLPVSSVETCLTRTPPDGDNTTLLPPLTVNVTLVTGKLLVDGVFGSVFPPTYSSYCVRANEEYKVQGKESTRNRHFKHLTGYLCWLFVFLADLESASSVITVVFSENSTRLCETIQLSSANGDQQRLTLTIDSRFNLSAFDLPTFRVGYRHSTVIVVEEEEVEEELTPTLETGGTTEGEEEEEGENEKEVENDIGEGGDEEEGETGSGVEVELEVLENGKSV